MNNGIAMVLKKLIMSMILRMVKYNNNKYENENGTKKTDNVHLIRNGKITITINMTMRMIRLVL